MRLDEQLERSGEDLDRVRMVIKDVVYRLRDGMAGQPKAQSYDSPMVNGHTTVTDDEGDSMPSVSDPTGEAAIRMVLGRDTSSATHRRIVKLASRIARDTSDLLTECVAVQRRGPTAKERAETEVANEPGCVSCHRLFITEHIHRWEPIFRTELCRWCYRWAGIHGGQHPPLEMLKAHHEGKRIHEKAG